MVERGEADDPSAVEAACAHLLAGRLVIAPTDTVYGLAALPSIQHATEALFAVKGRPSDVPLAVLVDSLDQALALVEAPDEPVARLAARLWPGPLTIVLRRRVDAGVELGGDGATVGVRCPDHRAVRALARSVGPLAVTSANRHGEPTPSTADELAAIFRSSVALILDGGTCAAIPSTVVDGTREELRILRAGPITSEQIAQAALL
ncbi:MAG: L-threonylcarbamoyladenylate synthase [Acidimicrobiales bacterium]